MKKSNFSILLLGSLVLRVALSFLFYYDSPIAIFSTHPPVVRLTSISPFPDVEMGSEKFQAINYLKSQGVIKGNSDGTFKPKSNLNRAEWAAILTRLAGAEPSIEKYKGCFPDVDKQWFAPSVCYAKEQGWMTGYKSGELAGKFGPDKSLQDIEVLVTMGRLLDWDMGEGGNWYEPALKYAKKNNLYTKTEIAKPLDRENMADVIFRSVVSENESMPGKDKKYTEEKALVVQDKEIEDIVSKKIRRDENILTLDTPPPAVSGDGSYLIFHDDNTVSDDSDKNKDEKVTAKTPLCDTSGAKCSPAPLTLKIGREKSIGSVAVNVKSIKDGKAVIAFNGKEKTMRPFDVEIFTDFIFVFLDADPASETIHAIKTSFPKNTNAGEHSLANVKVQNIESKILSLDIKEISEKVPVGKGVCESNYKIALDYKEIDATTGDLVDKKSYDLIESTEEVACLDATLTDTKSTDSTSTTSSSSSTATPPSTSTGDSSKTPSTTSTDRAPLTIDADALYRDSTKIKLLTAPYHASNDGGQWVTPPPTHKDEVKLYKEANGADIVKLGNGIAVNGAVVTVAKGLKGDMVQVEVYNPNEAEPYKIYVMNLYNTIKVNGKFVTNGGFWGGSAYVYTTDVQPKSVEHLLELTPQPDDAIDGTADTVSEVMIIVPPGETKAGETAKIEIIAWNKDGHHVKVTDAEQFTLAIFTGDDTVIHLPLTYVKNGSYTAEFMTSGAGWYEIYGSDGSQLIDRMSAIRVVPNDPVTVNLEVTMEQRSQLFKDTKQLRVTLRDKYGNPMFVNVEDFDFRVDGLATIIGKYSYGEESFIDVRGTDLGDVKVVATYKKNSKVKSAVKSLNYQPVMLDFDPGLKAGEKTEIGMHIWLPEKEGKIKSYEMKMEYDPSQLSYTDFKDTSYYDGFMTTVTVEKEGSLIIKGKSEYPDRNAVHVADIGVVVGEVLGEGAIVIPEITVVANTEKVIRMPESTWWGESYSRWWYNVKPVYEICLDVWIVEGAATRSEVMEDVNLAADIFSFGAALCKCDFWLNFKVNFKTVISQVDWRTKVDVAGLTPDLFDDESAEYPNLKNNFSGSADCVQVWYVPDLPGGTRALSFPNNGGVAMHNAMDNANTSLGHELIHQLSGNKVLDSPDDVGNAQGAQNFGNPMNYIHRGHVMTKEQCQLIKSSYPYK